MKGKNHLDGVGKFRQFVAAFVANFSALAYGTMVGWQSPMTPQFQSENSPVGTEPMSDEAASWLTGVLCLSGTFATLGVGVLSEKYGRKMTGCLIALPFSISWLLMIFATEHMHLFVARFFSGVGGAVTLYLVPLYVSEVSCDEIRGMLGSLMVFFLNIGILLAYIMGTYLTFHTFSITALVITLLYLGAFVFMPETPVYLVRRNRLHEAARSLMWLKAGNKEAVEQAISRLQAEVKEHSSLKSARLSDLFRDRGTIKALIISLGLFGGQQFCGIFAMISYTVTIFRISGSSLSPNTSTIIIGVIQVFGSYLSTSLMERMGRRPLLLISCLGMGISHFVLGVFCYLQALEYDVTSFSWISVVALSMYVILYCLGMGPGPYVVTSEIFSRNLSSLATTIAMFFVWAAAFLVVKFFPIFVNLLGMHGCFFLLGSSCVGSFVFTYILLLETKGRPRQEILDELNGVPYVVGDKQYLSAKIATEKNIPSPEPV